MKYKIEKNHTHKKSTVMGFELATLHGSGQTIYTLRYKFSL